MVEQGTSTQSTLGKIKLKSDSKNVQHIWKTVVSDDYALFFLTYRCKN